MNLILNKLSGGDIAVYRIEVLGFIHCVLYAAVIMFLMYQFRLKRRILDIAVKILILIVLCDVGYLTYFNSFYGEGLQLISLVFLAAMLIRVLWPHRDCPTPFYARWDVLFWAGQVL